MFARATLLAVLATATTAKAESYSVTARTLLRTRQERRGDEVFTSAPLYQLVTLTSSPQDLSWAKDTRMVLSVWGDADVAQPRDDRHFDGDIDLAYAEGAVWDGNVLMRAGRQLILGGAARNLQLDGLSVTSQLASGFGATVYGGAPVTRRFEVDRGDAAFGARIFYRHSFSTEVGASAIYVLDKGKTAREDLALDGRYSITPTLSLTGYGLFSAAEGRLATADAQLVWLASRKLDLVLEGRQTAPDLFLPRDSIFTVFSEESRKEIGGRAHYLLWSRFDVSAAYYFLSAPAGEGYRIDADARWTAPRQRTVAGLEGGRLVTPSSEADRDGYWHARVFGRHRLGSAVWASADMDYYDFDNDKKPSVLGSGSIQYHFAQSWQVVLSGRGGSTPLYDHYVEGFLKIVYNATYTQVLAANTPGTQP